MSIKIKSNSGSGSISNDNIFSFNYTEDLLPNEPSSSDGGASSVTFSSAEISSDRTGNTFPNSKLLINNSMVISDSDRGDISFQVKKVSTNAGVATIVGDTVQSKLNVEKTAEPFYYSTNTFAWQGVANASSSNCIGRDGKVKKTNLVRNPSFENGIFSGWSSSPTGLSINTTDAYSGTNSLMYTPTTTSTVLINFISTSVVLKPATKYVISFYIKASGWAGGQTWKTFGDIVRAPSGGVLGTIANSNFYLTSSWTRVQRSFTTPVDSLGGTGFILMFYIGSAPNTLSTGQNVLIDAVQLEEGSVATKYFDGSFATSTDETFTGKLSDAIKYYCSLCGVTATTWQTGAYEPDIVLPGWTGNVWEYLKMLCSGYSNPSSGLDNWENEIFTSMNGDVIDFSLISMADNIKIEDYAIDFSQDVDTSNIGQNIEIYNYNTSVGTNKIIYEISNYDDNTETSKKFLSSFSDSFQVDPGQTVTKTFEIDAYLININQPTCVSTISSIPYVGTTGEYVIVGNDDLEILPSQWTGEGGSLKVEIGEKSNEVKITVTAPNTDSLISKDGQTLTYGPYRIGVETSGDGTDYPALWITGTGVFYKKEKYTILTGADSTIASADNVLTIDNPFIVTKNSAFKKGIMSAQLQCGPVVTASVTTNSSMPYSDFANPYKSGPLGRFFYENSNMFKIKSVNHSYDSLSFDAIANQNSFEYWRYYSSKGDFLTNNWDSAKTFANFTTTTSATDKLTFNEFSIIPLIEPKV